MYNVQCTLYIKDYMCSHETISPLYSVQYTHCTLYIARRLPLYSAQRTLFLRSIWLPGNQDLFARLLPDTGSKKKEKNLR